MSTLVQNYMFIPWKYKQTYFAALLLHYKLCAAEGATSLPISPPPAQPELGCCCQGVSGVLGGLYRVFELFGSFRVAW